jgi:hypothetical protein
VRAVESEPLEEALGFGADGIREEGDAEEIFLAGKLQDVLEQD